MEDANLGWLTDSRSGSYILNGYTPISNAASSNLSYLYRTFGFDELFNQISNKNLPEVSKEEWNKIRELLGSEDFESLQLAFEMLNGYHFPDGIMNLISIKKALVKFINFLNKPK